MIVDFIEFLIFIRVVFAKNTKLQNHLFLQKQRFAETLLFAKGALSKKAYALSPIGSKSSVPLFQRSSMPRVMS